MKWIALLSATRSIVFSVCLVALPQGNRDKAYAMGGPVYIDTACETMRVAEASPDVKTWLKREMREGRAPQGLERFVKDVAANNENWRKKCADK